MPTVVAVKQVTLTADADSTDATDEGSSSTTTVLPPGAFVTYLPSERIGPIACGDTLSPEMFGTDTTARLSRGLGCTSEPYGLKITASGKTLDLNKFKIVGVTALGNVGILVSNAVDVTIIGGSTGGNSGIEFFDWCVKDEGKSVRLAIMNLRCFRARTAGFDITSKKASITGVLVDRAVGTTTTTAEPPGGVGIRTRGDQARIKDSIVRKTGAIGIWVAGTDSNGDGRVASIEGNTSTMRIENSAGIGLAPRRWAPQRQGRVCRRRLQRPRRPARRGQERGGGRPDRRQQPPRRRGGQAIRRPRLRGRRPRHQDLAFQCRWRRPRRLRGHGAGSTISGNGVQNARHGFIVTVTGLDADLESNAAEELDGDGFVVDGDTPVLAGNSAEGNGGRGFAIGGDSGLLDTNTAERNLADGFIVTGSGHTLKGNNSKRNVGTGFTVSGTDSHLDSNAAEQNTSSEWVIGPNNFDDGSNKKNGSVFLFTSSGGTFD